MWSTGVVSKWLVENERRVTKSDYPLIRANEAVGIQADDGLSKECVQLGACIAEIDLDDGDDV